MDDRRDVVSVIALKWSGSNVRLKAAATTPVVFDRIGASGYSPAGGDGGSISIVLDTARDDSVSMQANRPYVRTSGKRRVRTTSIVSLVTMGASVAGGD